MTARRAGTTGWPGTPPGTAPAAARGAPRPGAGRSRRRSAPRSRLASAISTTTRISVISAERRRPRRHRPSCSSAETKATILSSAQTRPASRQHEPDARRRCGTAALAPRALRCGTKLKRRRAEPGRCIADRVADQAAAGGCGASGAAPRGRTAVGAGGGLEAELLRTRPPAGGTATGRRARITSSMARMAQTTARDVALVERRRHVGADAGQLPGVVADGDRLGGDDEEPAAGHRHHRVPDQPRHGERHFQPPEPLPAVRWKLRAASSRSAGTVRQRLVEAERHVPGLAGEDREDRRQFQPHDACRGTGS